MSLSSNPSYDKDDSPPTMTHEPPFTRDTLIPEEEGLSSFEGENKDANDDSDVQSEFEEVNAELDPSYDPNYPP